MTDKTLELFNGVIAKGDAKDILLSEEYGVVIEKGARWAKNEIISFLKSKKLSGQDLNKSFYKSWETVKNSSRLELYRDQIIHYFSTYGTNFTEEMWVPKGILDIPDLKIKFKVIRAFTKEELTQKCLDMLTSGIALKEITIDNILEVLFDVCKYTFTGKEQIRNKEAIVKIADKFGVYPVDPVEFLRCVVYKSTGSTLLIKNKLTLNQINISNFNPTVVFNEFGLEKLATIFNRFKPIFLMYKGFDSTTINKISKLSKKYHKPLIQNPLNSVTSRLLTIEDLHWLENATPFALFKALNACNSRLYGQDNFMYRIRNGKSWTTQKSVDNFNADILFDNYYNITEFLKKIYQSYKGLKYYIPEDVEFALPTSEKMFVGNIPVGTKFIGDDLQVGVYWENKFGVYDLDLSAILRTGEKCGWNAAYNTDGQSITYSGDMTNAPHGAVEYLHIQKNCSQSGIIYASAYYGAEEKYKFKVIVGKADLPHHKYMMNPNNLILNELITSNSNENVIGLINQIDGKQCFTILNSESGNARVSVGKDYDQLDALIQQYSHPLTFNRFLENVGAIQVDDKNDADFNFSLDNLEKDTFTKFFS